jgi:hypothetical protein
VTVAADSCIEDDLDQTSLALEELPPESEDITEDRMISQAAELVELRNTTPVHEIFATLTTHEARKLYGDKLIDDASIEELNNCMHKGAWECLDPSRKGKFIPSKMLLTPKKLPS